jgi:DNA-binding HxlR family transcriptional regulator
MCSQRRCPEVPEEIRRVADLLERRWALTVLYACQSGAVRFNDFAAACGRIPPATLATRLAELEQAGLLERRVVPDARPPRVEYGLTERGQELRVLLAALSRFAARSA